MRNVATEKNINEGNGVDALQKTSVGSGRIFVGVEYWSAKRHRQCALFSSRYYIKLCITLIFRCFISDFP